MQLKPLKMSGFMRWANVVFLGGKTLSNVK